MNQNAQVCGVISGLYRYPVKSMRGESLTEAHLSWHGLDGDRRYAFVRQGANSGFPWFTGRELPQLLLYTPRLLQPERECGGHVIAYLRPAADASGATWTLLQWRVVLRRQRHRPIALPVRRWRGQPSLRLR